MAEVITTGRKSDEFFIWIPRKYSTKYEVVIDGVDERLNVLEGSFTKAVAPTIGSFKIRLDNNNGRFTDKFVGGEEVEFRYDFGSGTTRRFLGTIEQAKDVFSGGGHQMDLEGSHVAGELLDRTVIASYDGSISADAVIKDLVDRFAPAGFTTSNVLASDVFPVATFNETPLWKTLSDVNDLAKNTDLYVDDSKDVHFFTQGSLDNDDEAVIMGDTLIELDALGKNLLAIRNKIRVYGEDADGQIVVYTASDSTSQGLNGLRISVLTDTNVITEDEAESLAESKLAVQKNNFDIGGGLSLMLATVSPGDFVYISSPVHGILGRFRFVEFTHQIPNEMTDFEVEDVRT